LRLACVGNETLRTGAAAGNGRRVAPVTLSPYISGMPKAELRWVITRIRGKRADRIGVVKAADADAAIKIAIRELKVTDSGPAKARSLTGSRFP
jgi:hypothetical protein